MYPLTCRFSRPGGRRRAVPSWMTLVLGDCVCSRDEVCREDASSVSRESTRFKASSSGVMDEDCSAPCEPEWAGNAGWSWGSSKSRPESTLAYWTGKLSRHLVSKVTIKSVKHRCYIKQIETVTSQLSSISYIWFFILGFGTFPVAFSTYKQNVTNFENSTMTLWKVATWAIWEWYPYRPGPGPAYSAIM